MFFDILEARTWVRLLEACPFGPYTYKGCISTVRLGSARSEC